MAPYVFSGQFSPPVECWIPVIAQLCHSLSLVSTRYFTRCREMGGQKNTNFVWTPTKRRGPIAAEFSSPGPAAIGLPSTFGAKVAIKHRSPAFTISGRHDNKPDSASPGPGQYNVNGLSYKGKDEVQAPSMHIRPRDPKFFVTPAPGDYQPEKSHRVLEPSPKFSFGIKAENGNISNIPAPNSYTIPRLVGTGKSWGTHQTSPSFTITGRPRPVEDKMKIPGPGSYNEALVDKYKTVKSPAFSMGLRTNIPSDATQKPGPGAHCPEKYNPDDGPKWTINPRPYDPEKSYVPGPGAYEAGNLHMLLEKQPIYSMSPKTELPVDKTPKPAPNAYSPEKYNPDDGPKWTMNPRPYDPEKPYVPGPGTYEAGNLNMLLEKQPIYTMSPKTELPVDKTPKPAPNVYSPEKYNPDDGPKWTMNPRPYDHEKPFVPGPGTYEAGNLNMIFEKQPIYTMSPKTELPFDKTPKPAPNVYSPEKYMTPDTPKWTMSPKTELPGDKTPKPSPNAYSPEKVVMQRTPEFSFGVRHSPYAGQLRDQ